MLRPYWADQTMLTGHRVGDAIDVIDNEKEYNVSVDVSQFEPEELKVNIVDNQLIIEGKHAEKTDKYGQVSRSSSERIESWLSDWASLRPQVHSANWNPTGADQIGTFQQRSAFCEVWEEPGAAAEVHSNHDRAEEKLNLTLLHILFEQFQSFNFIIEEPNMWKIGFYLLRPEWTLI